MKISAFPPPPRQGGPPSSASCRSRPRLRRPCARHRGLPPGPLLPRWYQLLEICTLAGTLIADSDGVYDPALYNDRLLLGLKSTISEAELHIMRARLDEGRRRKAARGELGFAVPRGYLRRADGEIVLNPDERVRATIDTIFAVFARRRSLHGVLRYLVARHALPDRERARSAKGELVWHPPHPGVVMNLLTNPIYAGAYV